MPNNRKKRKGIQIVNGKIIDHRAFTPDARWKPNFKKNKKVFLGDYLKK